MTTKEATHDNSLMLIFLLDHHPITSEMMTMLIRRIHPGARIAVSHSFKQLKGLIEKHEDPDYIFIEPQSTGCVGVLSISHIKKLLPDAKIIITTDSKGIIDAYFKAGASGFIEKTLTVKEIFKYLAKILKIKDRSADCASPPIGIVKISKRHSQLINLLDQGYTNQQIALKLGITENTVKIHFSRLYKILNVKNRLQALSFARENGWIMSAPML